MNNRNRFTAGGYWLAGKDLPAQDYQIAPTWLVMMLARIQPGTCSKCYHRWNGHFSTCERYGTQPGRA